MKKKSLARLQRRIFSELKGGTIEITQPKEQRGGQKAKEVECV